MATQLAQNQFVSNSALQAAESAVASKPPPVADATAAPVPVSDGVPLQPSETEGAVCVTAASSDNFGCLTADDERLYWSLRLADHPFTRDLEHIPDAHALFDAALEVS